MSAATALIVVVVARMLGVAQSGEVAFGIWVGTTTAQVALLGLSTAGMRFLASPRDRPGIAGWVARRGIVLVIPGMIGSAGLSWAIGHARGSIVATALLTGGIMLSSVGAAILSGEQRFRRLAFLSIVSAAAQVGGTAIGAALGGASGALLGQAAGNLPLAVPLGHAVRDATRPSRDVLARVRTFALQTWLATSASLVAWSRLEFAFLQARGPSAVALYAAALTIAQFGSQPTTLLGSALLPHFGELVGGGHDATQRETFAAATRVCAFFALPLCFGLAALSPALVRVLFGEGFAPAALPAAILASSAAVIAIAPAASALMYAHERTRFNAIIAAASAAMAGISFAVLIPLYGAVGAAVARSVVQALGVFAGFTYLAHVIRARAPLAHLLRATLGASVSAIAARTVIAYAGSTWLSVVAGTAVAVVVYAVAAAPLRLLQASDAQHLERLLAWVPVVFRRPARLLIRSVAR